MLVLISLLHFVQSSQDTVPQHAVWAKPHSPKSIGEASINFIFEGTHQTPRINILICISQAYPEIISTGNIIQFQECDLSIQVAIEGSFWLPVLSFSNSANFGDGHQSYGSRVQLTIL